MDGSLNSTSEMFQILISAHGTVPKDQQLLPSLETAEER